MEDIIPKLGLPPMELAETKDGDCNTMQKYFKLLYKKVGTLLLFLVFIIGIYFIFFKVCQNEDNVHSTEIIVVTGIREAPNVTVHKDNIEISLRLNNNTSQTSEKRRKRQVSIDSRMNYNIFRSLDDKDIKKARDIIMNHKPICNEDNQNEVCKDLVMKLKSITKHDEFSSKNVHIHRRNKGIFLRENKSKVNTMKRTNDEKHENNDDVTPSTVAKRETQPMTNQDTWSTPNWPIHTRESSDGHNPSTNLSPQLQQLSNQVPPMLITDRCLSKVIKKYPRIEASYNAPASEYVPPQYQPIPYARYDEPHPQGRNVETHRRKLHPQDEEIFKSFLNRALKRNLNSTNGFVPNSTSRQGECPIGTMPCANGDECINEKQWCDGNVDCFDVSDETRCSCKSRVDKSRLCDGYFDCPYGEDEMGCFGCSEETFSCEDTDINSRSTCFTKEQRCDDHTDCPNRYDEVDCNLLSSNLQEKTLYAISNTEGFLQRNFKGNWYAVCNNPYMWAHDACRRETGLIIRPPFLQMVQTDPTLKVNYLNTATDGLIYTSEMCFNSSAVYVTCPDLLCGTRVMSTSQLIKENAALENNLFGRNKRFLLKRPSYPVTFYDRRLKRHTTNTILSALKNKKSEKDITLINNVRRKRMVETRVVGGKPSKPAAWPWMVALYRDGTFHCGSVILTQNWVMSAAHCVDKFWDHYYEVQVGMLRRFSFSPQEHNHRVTDVIVNQNYDREDMKNDLSLLRVVHAIQFSRWVRPICLPGPETAGVDWMWGPQAGTSCVAVGWGATVEHGPDPDHLREVEVPIWPQCKHKEDLAGNEICAGLAEGGKDACQGDSGGPLLCRNPLNPHQWYVAGIVSHGDGCARKGEPGVYTRVSLFVKWIRYNIASKTLPIIQPKQECPGFKCVSGFTKCLPKKRMCDKIIDCLDGEDEIYNCNSMRFAQNQEDIFLTVREKEEENEKAETSASLKNESSNYKDFTTEYSSQNVKNLLDFTDSDTSTNIYATAATITTTEHIDDINFNSDLISTLRPNVTAREHEIIKYTKHDFQSLSETLHFRNSEEKGNNVNDNQNSTLDPLGTTSSEERHPDDMHIITTTILNEPLQSKSFVRAIPENQRTPQAKEADMNENWSEFMDSFNIDIETSTNTLSTEESTTHINIDVNGKQENEFSTNQSMKNQDSNENTGKESKQFFVELLPTAHFNVSQPTNEESHNLTKEETKELQNISSDSTKSPSVKELEEIVLSEVQPAKIRKKHLIPKEFICQRIFQNILYQQRCDHKADCEDGTDELGCTCLDYLSTFNKELICDGVFDCAEGQDESDCYGCAKEHFLCQHSQTCLPLKYVCDGKLQCPHGEDESDCFTLSNGKEIVYDFNGKPKINLEGFITRKHANDWHVVCENHISIDKQEDTATHICRYLGFSSANRFSVKYININKHDIHKTNSEKVRIKRDGSSKVPIHFAYGYINEDDSSARHTVIEKPDFIQEQCVPNVTKTCSSLYVVCDRSLFTDFAIPQEFFYGRSADTNISSSVVTPTTWPWTAKIYVEGNYKCTGILIDVSWVLLNHLCLWDSLYSHNSPVVSVVLGSHRTLNTVNGPYEQSYHVDAKKDIYRSKVVLLHLREPAQYSVMVKPMVVPHVNFLEERNNFCVAVGEDDNNTTVYVYLEETNEECDSFSRCFKRQSKSNICPPNMVSHRPWAGIISCHSQDGWYPSATFVDNRGECGLGDKINAIDIGNIRSDIKQYLGQPISQSTDLSLGIDNCEGERCGRGRCVGLLQVCNGVRDCEDGNDESEHACDKKNSICGADPFHVGCECTSGQLKCRNGRCVPKELFRDGHDDCGDGTDEPGETTCSDYLRRVMPSRLCDGILHCHDRSDEDPLFCKCHAKLTYPCSRSGEEHCVAPDMVCDGMRDCPNGEDETTCMALSSSVETPRGTGLVIMRSHGINWHSKCYPTQRHTKAELETICRQLGFISGHAKELIAPGKSIFDAPVEVVLEPFQEIVLNNKTTIKLRNTDLPLARSVLSQNMTQCHTLYIECL